MGVPDNSSISGPCNTQAQVLCTRNGWVSATIRRKKIRALRECRLVTAADHLYLLKDIAERASRFRRVGCRFDRGGSVVFFERAGLDRTRIERVVTDSLKGADDGELYWNTAVRGAGL